MYKFQKLSDLALTVIAKDFNQHFGVMEVEEPLMKNQLFSKLDIENCKIEILCKYIKEEEFWKQACKKIFNLSIIRDKTNKKTFKNLYLENFLQNYLRENAELSQNELKVIIEQIGPYLIDFKLTDNQAGSLLAEIFPQMVNIRRLSLNVYSKNERELKISNFGMNWPVIESLTEAFECFSVLEKLDLSNNQIELKKIECLAQQMYLLNNLQELNLSKNKIDNLALQKAAELLAESEIPKVRVLDLSCNNLSSGCGDAVVQIIENFAGSLEELILNDNLIENFDLHKIFEGISRFECNLVKLDVSNNLINEGIFPVFVDFIDRVGSIREVNLELNNFQLNNNQVNSLKKIVDTRLETGISYFNLMIDHSVEN